MMLVTVNQIALAKKRVKIARSERLRLAIVAHSIPRADVIRREDAIGEWVVAYHTHKATIAHLARITGPDYVVAK